MTCRRCAHPLTLRKYRSLRRPAPGTRVHEARGLCSACVTALRRHDPDALLDYTPTTRRREDVLAEWELLRSDGCSKREAAARIGMSYAAFERALQRAAKAAERAA